MQGSDLDLIKAELKPIFGDRMSMRVPASNPAERSPGNALNSRLMSAAGEIRFMVDPTRAPNPIRDLEGVALLKGGSGGIDKKSDLSPSPISDAAGHHVAKEFPVISHEFVQGFPTWG